MTNASSASKNISDGTKLWFHINFDGGSRGNPGISGAGTEVITRVPTNKAGGRSEIKRTKTHIRTYCGDMMTNNQAEYQGAISGLEFVWNVLQEEPPSTPVTLVLQGDSNLIIQQLHGCYKCNSIKLKPLYQKAKKIIADIRKKFKTFDATYEHVYRRDNKTADGAYLKSGKMNGLCHIVFLV